MKVLAIADEESRYLWDFFQPEKLKDIDLILSCGDLKAQYLDFLATFTHAPILYVHGNHDERYKKNPPDSCNCICVNSCFFQSSCGCKIHTVNARLCVDGLGKFLNRRCKTLLRGVFPYLVSCFKYLGSRLGALTEIFSHSGILCALSCK